MYNFPNPLRLNVGFIVHQAVGYSRDFDFDFSRVHIDPDLDLENFHIRVIVSRTSEGLLVQVNGHADATGMMCVRCLSEFTQSLQVDFTELYAFLTHAQADTELILPETGYIDLGPLAREYMILDMPISPVCGVGCKGLCPICGENLNTGPCHHEDDEIDPRLAKLRSL